MSVPDRYRLFWQEFARSRVGDPTLHFLEAFHFDDNELSANELVGLVLSGQKPRRRSVTVGARGGVKAVAEAR